MRYNIENKDAEQQQSTEDQLKAFTENMSATEEKLEKLREEMKKTMQKEFNSSIQEIFRLVPRLKSFAWTQYSPYFNDGDECVFRVNQVNALSFIPDYGSYSYEVENDDDFIIADYDSANTESLTVAEKEAIQKVIDFIENSDDLMEDLYGNHVSVILTADGANVDGYDHD